MVINIAIGIVIGIIVLWIASNYLWNKKYRPWSQKRGHATPMFNEGLRRTLKFIFLEDKEPFAKAPAAFINRKFAYLVLLVASIGGFFADTFIGVILLMILITVVFSRTRAIFTARNTILRRMFEVAHSEFGYAANSNLNPWAFIKVKQWDSLTTPGSTEVSYPAKFRSDDPKKREGFENHFNGTVSEENTWIYTWDTAKGIVSCVPVTHVPERAPYMGSKNSPWNEIPMGLGAAGEVKWDVSVAPHILICGGTGGGKSVTQRNIIFHCIQHSDRWRFLGVDLKRVELSPYKKYDDVVLGIARTLEDGVEVLRFARDEMMGRYEQIEQFGLDHFMKLPDPPFALMVMIDEAYMFMSPEGVKTDEGKARDELHGEATTLIGEIARLGRAAGVHLVVATQRPDAKVIYGEIKENLAVRYAAGKMKSTASQMVLDSDGATRVPGHIKGRAVMSINGDEVQLQGYFAENKWIDEYLNSLEPESNVSLSKDRPDAEDDGMFVDPPQNLDDGKIDDRFRKESDDESSTGKSKKSLKGFLKKKPSEEQQVTEEGMVSEISVKDILEDEDPSNRSGLSYLKEYEDDDDMEDAFPAPRMKQTAPAPVSAPQALPAPSKASLPMPGKPRPAPTSPLPSLIDDEEDDAIVNRAPQRPAPSSSFNLEEDDDEDDFAFTVGRPKLSSGNSRPPREEDAWDDAMEAIFADIAPNTLPIPEKARPSRPMQP
jgi:FtsK/SpoIIIE family